ncbi:Protein fem-1, partial [Clarias magur]
YTGYSGAPGGNPPSTGRTCKLHAHRPKVGNDPSALQVKSNSANHYATVWPDLWTCLAILLGGGSST